MRFSTFVHSLGSKLIAGGYYRRFETYIYAVNSITRFHGGEAKLKAVFTREFLRDYHDFLIRSGCDTNTIASYIATLRSIARQAAAAGKIDSATSPFDHIRTRVVPGAKRALHPGLLGRVFTADLSAKRRLEPCRDYLILSVMLQGISFVDLAHLRKSDVQGNVISYSRSKTGSSIQIPISPGIRKILAKYAEQTADSSYLLPIITLTGPEGYKEYKTAIHRQNRQLKELAAYLGIKENLTTYSFRHSWATIAYHNGVEIGIVSQGMGHQQEKTTRTYLAPFDIEKLDEANQIVLRTILKSVTGKRCKVTSHEDPGKRYKVTSHEDPGKRCKVTGHEDQAEIPAGDSTEPLAAQAEEYPWHPEPETPKETATEFKPVKKSGKRKRKEKKKKRKQQRHLRL